MPVLGGIGERVVCYLEQIGRVEGTVARHFEHGFALGFSVPLIKREKWAEQLTWLANRHALGMPEDRRHGRIVPRHLRTVLAEFDGKREELVPLSGNRFVSRDTGAQLTFDEVPFGMEVKLDQAK